jgi:hypothetical protein
MKFGNEGTGAMELRGQGRSQMEFGNEGEGAEFGNEGTEGAWERGGGGSLGMRDDFDRAEFLSAWLIPGRGKACEEI